LSPALELYPAGRRARDAWIVAQRPARETLDPWKPHAFFVEEERTESGEIVPVAAIFLTNRECPWRCLMCDLWKHTLTERVPVGAIPAQLEHALARLPAVRQIKLYNSGSFFDSQAIPPEDYGAIAERLRPFERVIVEAHPAFVGDRCWRFAELVGGRLEVAIGLETAHPEVLARLNKGVTLAHFARVATELARRGVALRTFILVKPPFLDETEALHWAERSLDFSFDCQATVASLIPTRGGNGALEALGARGEFAPPRLRTLEAAAAYGVALRRGRVFADVWDLERFSTCPHCLPARAACLREMNLRQRVPPRVVCAMCGE